MPEPTKEAEKPRYVKDREANVRAKESAARHAAKQAIEAADLAKTAERIAKEALAEAMDELRTEALKGAVDTVVKGAYDLWPELNMVDEDLVKKIATGVLDGVVSELAEMARAHPKHKHDGTLSERGTVIAACKARGAKIKAG